MRVPIPGSAHARSTAAQKRDEELGIISAGDLPVNEVRQNSGNAAITKACLPPNRLQLTNSMKKYWSG